MTVAVRKKRKVNRAWNSYIEPRAAMGEILAKDRARRIYEHLARFGRR